MHSSMGEIGEIVREAINDGEAALERLNQMESELQDMEIYEMEDAEEITQKDRLAARGYLVREMFVYY